MFGRRYAIICSAPDILLSSAGKNVLDLFRVVFIVGLRKNLISTHYVMQDTNLSMNLISSGMIRMMIVT
jgi:hypothetical protein